MAESLDQWLRRSEGLRLKPYMDTKGRLTIGFGHNLDANGITIAIANSILEADIALAKKNVIDYLPWILNFSPARQDAFYHLSFWIGIGKLLEFTKMLGAAKAEDWDRAVQELLNSALHNDIPIRTEEIANQLLKGE